MKQHNYSDDHFFCPYCGCITNEHDPDHHNDPVKLDERSSMSIEEFLGEDEDD